MKIYTQRLLGLGIKYYIVFKTNLFAYFMYALHLVVFEINAMNIKLVFNVFDLEYSSLSIIGEIYFPLLAHLYKKLLQFPKLETVESESINYSYYNIIWK